MMEFNYTYDPIYTCEVCDKKCTGDEADENNICYVPDLEEESNKIDNYELLCWSCVTKFLGGLNDE